MKSSSKKSKKITPVKKVKTPIAGHPQYCALPRVPQRTFAPSVGPRRAEIILVSSNKWVNGTKLKYYFFKGASDGSPANWKGSQASMEAVRKGFKKWKNLGLGLEFEEVNDPLDAQVRIGFMNGDGSWSYVGRDIIDANIGDDARTMNFGWDIIEDPDTILHEIGHTLGFPHEHQNPYAGIVWNEPAVYAALAAPPNSWDHQTTFENIIRKLNMNDVEGTQHDPDSIMHYPFEAGLIKEPAKYRDGLTPAGGLSPRDIEYALKFYPKLDAKDYTTILVGKLQNLNIEPGEQRNFIFRPKKSKSYTIHTLGVMDTVMVLFEKANGEEIQIAGDDDSGKDENAKITMKLIRGREYVIRIRLYYKEKSGETSLIIT